MHRVLDIIGEALLLLVLGAVFALAIVGHLWALAAIVAAVGCVRVAFVLRKRSRSVGGMADVTIQRARSAGRAGIDGRIGSDRRKAMAGGGVMLFVLVAWLLQPALPVLKDAWAGDTGAIAVTVIMVGLMLLGALVWVGWHRSDLMVRYLLWRMHAFEPPVGSTVRSVLDDLALATGLTPPFAHPPLLRVVTAEAANVFSLGTSPDTGAIVVTSRLLGFPREELRAAIAGPLAHLISGRAVAHTVSSERAHGHEDNVRRLHENAADSEGLHIHRDPAAQAAMLRRFAELSVSLPEWKRHASPFRHPLVWAYISVLGGSATIPDRIARLNEMLGALGSYEEEREGFLRTV